MSLKIIKIKKSGNDYFQSNLLLIEENINKLNLLEKEKEKKIFALKRKIQERQEKKNKFIGKVFKTMDEIDDLRIVCKELDELDVLESIEKTLQILKRDLIKSGVEPIKSVEEIIDNIDDEEQIQIKSERRKIKAINKNMKKLIAIATVIIILTGSFITLSSKKRTANDKEKINNISQQDTVNKSYNILDELIRFKDDDKYGFKNESETKVIEPKYEDAKQFSEELAAVQLNGKWGYIDKEGKKVIEEEYEDAKPFSEGVAAVKLNEKWGYIDKKGKKVIEDKYDEALQFSNGIAKVILDGESIEINKDGKVVNSKKNKNEEIDKELSTKDKIIGSKNK